MKQLALALALSGACVSSAVLSTPAWALETYQARMEATDAAAQAQFDMFEAFGFKNLKAGQYLWRDVPDDAGPERVVISLSGQLAYLYRGDTLMAVATISTGVEGRDTPTGIFAVRGKTLMHRSKKYDNAPMPFMQRLTWDGIALHAGAIPGHPASHGCIRLPMAFSNHLFAATQMGGQVHIIGESPPSAAGALAYVQSVAGVSASR
jgi:lipoprotein-anchoring transpeptidase ErfK/SrfK